MLHAVITRLTEPAERVPVGRRLLYGVALAGFCVAATLSVQAAGPVRAMDGWGLLLLVVPALAAPFAALTPVPVLALTASAPAGFYAAGYASIFAPAPLTAAVFLAVLYGRGPYALSAALATCLGAYAAGLAHGLGPGAAAVGPGWITGWLVAAAGVGEALRKRRQLLDQERLRAENAARRGAEQERLRIARELHDSLTHSISVITVQASAAAHLFDRAPERVPGALSTIRQAGAEALHELRSTVEVLRRIDAGGGDPADEPRPGVARLPRLLDGSRAAGLQVQARLDVEPGVLPPEVDRAAYRIVQEALNNAARYAPGSRVEVALAGRGGALVVTVRNGPARSPSPAGTAPGGGQGLTGMRERVDVIGGELHTGPYDGGFRVHAVLPLPAPAEKMGP
ncbi:sensor histidine kinase [Streptomyces albidoflavus]|uniref:sensor histidine kinase n=1 Tax=Streptomyces albidoflavus TaxID=1886 RepID=UPI0033BB055F